MTTRVVVLADGRRVGLGAYVAAWRHVRKAPPGSMIRGAPGSHRADWDSAAVALRQFRTGMHDRINRHLPGYGHGRKWSSDWQRAAIQTAGLVNIPRVRVHWIPRDLAGRLAHRLARADD